MDADNGGFVLQPNSPVHKDSSSGSTAGLDVTGGQQVTHSYNRKRKRKFDTLNDSSRSSSSCSFSDSSSMSTESLFGQVQNQEQQ